MNADGRRWGIGKAALRFPQPNAIFVIASAPDAVYAQNCSMKIGAKISKVRRSRALPAGREVLPNGGGGAGAGPGRSRAGSSGGARISGTRPARRGGRFPRKEVGVCALGFGVDMAVRLTAKNGGAWPMRNINLRLHGTPFWVNRRCSKSA